MKTKYVLTALAVIILTGGVMVASRGFATEPWVPGTHGPSGYDPSLFAGVSPSSADTTLTISVNGSLTGDTTACGANTGGGDTIYSNQITGGAYSVVGGAVQITDGPLAGQSIPVHITRPEVDGACDVPAQIAAYAGSQSFDTSALEQGNYTINLKMTDDEGGIATRAVSFAIDHHTGGSGNPGGLTIACSPSTAHPTTHTPVTWTASASGGSNYTYAWSGTDGLSGSTANVTKTYPTEGPKDASVRVTSGSLSGTATCSTLVTAPGDVSLTCSPSSTTALPDQVLNFSAANGFIPYSWSTNFGNPSSGAGSSFNTKFSSEGFYAVKVTDHSGAFSRCFVQVQPSTCTQPATINVVSNVPTTWSLAGPTPQTQTVPATSATYAQEQTGVPYHLSAAVLPGYAAPVVSPDSWTPTCGSAPFTFSINYASNSGQTPTPPPGQPGSPQLVVAPSLSQTEVGAYAYFGATYDPDGSGPMVGQSVSTVASWSSSDTSKAGYAGTGTGSAAFLGNSPGTVDVTATYAGLSAGATLMVTDHPPAALTALLVPNPDQGNAPLSTTLTAAVGGTAQGTINYTWWLNCNYVGTSISGATAQCGQPWKKIDATNSNPVSVAATYTTAGNPVALVIVERGGYAAQAGAIVVVHASQQPAMTHHECVANACAMVNGAGPDRCTASADCGGGGGGGGFYGVCDPVQKVCVNRAGTNGSSCASDPACAGVTQSHLECQNQSCVIVGGAGSNSCETVGSTCGAATPSPTPTPGAGGGSCNLMASPKIISKGGSTHISWICTGGIAACNLTDENTGLVVKSGSATIPPFSLSPATTTTYLLSCNSGAFTTSTTVRVLSITEVPPKQ